MTQVGFLAMWIAFTVIALGGIIAVLVWAVRARQFSDQNHARYLPLESVIPGPDKPPADDAKKETKAG
jgi:nitrogen fixation-related uncharacterized protein